MSAGPLFSAVVKPDRPLLYICDQTTLITNISVCPIVKDEKAAKPLSTLQPFVTVLKLQYEGPVIEGEKDDEEKPNKKSTNGKKTEGDEDDDEDDDDYSGSGIEAKEVVVGCFTPNVLQIHTEIFLTEEDQYRFVLSGGADYEVHLLGRYLTGPTDDYPYGDSDDESDDDLDDLLDQTMSDDDDESQSDRIAELKSDDDVQKPTEAIKAPTKSNKPAPASAKSLAEAKSNKRALEDKDISADISMADSTAGDDSTAKLSKSQRKKLKKNKTLSETNSTAETTEPIKKPEAPKPNTDSKPAAPLTVTLPSGLKIMDTKIGQGVDAKAGQQISMRYIGKLTNGKVFDSNTKGKPFNFRLGKGEVIKGWDEGIKGMKVGGERKLTVPSNLAYGKNGAPPDIPPNSNLIFEVKCLAIK